MLKYAGYDIVFQEFPDEVTLAVNLTCCPNHCPGCHSAYLQRDTGEELSERRLLELIRNYNGEITCVGLMGGDNDPASVVRLLARVKAEYPQLRTGWYSGRSELPQEFDTTAFDYVKLGGYVASLGPLKERTTNQRLFRYAADGSRTDITPRFWR